MTDREALDTAGEILMQMVRDRVIGRAEQILKGEMKSLDAQEMHAALVGLTADQRDAVRRLAVDVITSTLFKMLVAVEETSALDGPGLKLIVSDSADQNHTNLAEVSDGLGGELFSKNGWIAKFSAFPEGYD